VRTLKVRYTIDALLHIGAIHSYIEERNPVAATRVIARVRTAAEQLGEHPRIGHAGALPGTLEWVVTGLPYVVVYEARANDDEIVVLGVYHSAQLRPGQ
jgi:toxin ParE1/3/4